MSRLIVFNFDGTGNEPEDAKQYDEQKDASISNILKLHFLMGGNLHRDGEHYGQSNRNNITHCFYYQGVGTYGGWFNRFINQGLAFNSWDVSYILNKARNDFLNHYRTGDTVLITGFSRGAALARRFVSLIEHAINNDDTPPFIFLCVFDTVASIGLPDLSTRKRPKFSVVFEYGRTISNIVKYATHLVSLDEKRKAFQPTLMNHDPNRITEIWFAGAHSDVGGGYKKDGLADVALGYAINWLKYMQQTHDLPRFTLDITDSDCLKQACPDSLQDVISHDELSLSPNALGLNHQQTRNFFIDWLTLDDRICCVMKDNKIDPSLTPVVHHSVAKRASLDNNYQPNSLEQTEHHLWHDFTLPLQTFSCVTEHSEQKEQDYAELDEH